MTAASNDPSTSSYEANLKVSGAATADSNNTLNCSLSSQCDMVASVTEQASEVNLNASKESIASDLNSSSDLSEYDGPGYDLGNMTCLPPEIVQCIMGHLDARYVLTCLSLVCRTFYHFVRDDTTWRLRVTKLSEKSYPVFQDESLDWPLACIQREEFHNLWNNPEDSMDHFILNEAHYASVDCVHLTQGGSFCFTGARDRTIQVWDLTKLDANDPVKSVEASNISSVIAHKGWIWHIASNQDKLCSSSWDCYLKIWDVTTELTELQILKGPSAFLCSVFHDDLLVAGSFDRRIYAYDPRDGFRRITTWHIHNGPVLCLAADDKYIISGSEDKHVKVFDRRAEKVLIEKKFKSFPMSMSYGYNQLWTGHKNGELNAMHPNSGLFNIVKTFDSGHTGKLTGVVHNLGGLCTCATDKTIKVHAPTDPIDTISTLADHKADVTAIALQNNVLVSAGGDISVGVWRPKDWSA